MKAEVTRNAIDLEDFTPEAMQEVIRGATLEHFVLGNDLCRFRGRQWTTGTFSVNTGSYSFATRILGCFPQDRITIGYMRRMSSTSWMNGFDVRTDHLQFYPEGTEVNYRSARNGEWVGIEMEREFLESTVLEHLGRELGLPRRGAWNVTVPLPLLGELDRLVMASLRPEADPRAMILPITRMIADLLASQNADSLRGSMLRWKKRSAELWAAESYLRSNLADGFNSDAFAAAMGRSERSLQLLFKEAYGFSPQHWARCLALHMARKYLQRINPRLYTIQAVAEECGFNHMGRFAHHYKALFGESPSMTLAKV
ncbi:MAG: AraC family transcriptional regulator [Verrucomicrobiae bacterium]|nr:AraC family transcriptional regulator [Verrucomicrobiae bacterium]MCP5544699.1 AraC family transcriptional regulator [Akkermansiaceae bacterium]